MKLLLRILSVITLIAGILSLAAGGINIGFFFHSGFPDPLAIALTVLVVVLLMVGGVPDVLCGLLCLRAATHPPQGHRRHRLRRAGGHSRGGEPVSGHNHPAPAQLRGSCPLSGVRHRREGERPAQLRLPPN